MKRDSDVGSFVTRTTRCQWFPITANASTPTPVASIAAESDATMISFSATSGRRRKRSSATRSVTNQ